MDKLNIWKLLDMHHTMSKETLNQWTLIMLCIQGLKKVKPEAWSDSFKKVNLHPNHRIPFPDWIKKIDTQLVTGERFFKNRSSLYDAMPTLWRNLSVEERRAIMSKIDGFYSAKEPWSPLNIVALAEYVPLENVPRLRACYFTAKRDPAIIDLIQEEVTETTEPELQQIEPGTLAAMLDGYQLFPQALLSEYKKDPTNDKCQDALFKHLTNHAAGKHWYHTSNPLAPSPYLNLDISFDQRTFLNPTIRDVLFSTLENDAYGGKAQKKRARRRQDFIDGNAKSYARWLNSPDQMEAYSDYNQIMASMALVRKDNDDNQRKAQERKIKNAESRQQSELVAQEEFELKRIALSPKIDEDLLKGPLHINSLKGPCLKDIIWYRFVVKSGVLNKMKVQEMKAFVVNKTQNTSN